MTDRNYREDFPLLRNNDTAYIDNAATAQKPQVVIDAEREFYEKSNANPLRGFYPLSLEATEKYESARKVVRDFIRADSEKEIIFTSGGTESDNLAIIGAARAAARRGKHLITTQIEHPAVLESMKYLNEEGFEISYLPVNAEGVLSIEDLKNTIRKDTILVSIMHTNNEIGSIQPIHEIGTWLKQNRPDIIFHVDAVQGYGKATA